MVLASIRVLAMGQLSEMADACIYVPKVSPNFFLTLWHALQDQQVCLTQSSLK